MPRRADNALARKQLGFDPRRLLWVTSRDRQDARS
jgi:hypothetical protein